MSTWIKPKHNSVLYTYFIELKSIKGLLIIVHRIRHHRKTNTHLFKYLPFVTQNLYQLVRFNRSSKAFRLKLKNTWKTVTRAHNSESKFFLSLSSSSSLGHLPLQNLHPKRFIPRILKKHPKITSCWTFYFSSSSFEICFGFCLYYLCRYFLWALWLFLCL